MKTYPKVPASLLLAAALLAAAGCSTPTSRIAKHQAAFNEWPAAVQEKVRAGEVAIGFTADQTLVALGDPDRKFVRTTTDGTTEVWAYRKEKSRFSFGIGIGSVRGSTGVGGGVVLGDRGDWRDGETMRVVFDRAGKVSMIETAERQ